MMKDFLNSTVPIVYVPKRFWDTIQRLMKQGWKKLGEMRITTPLSESEETVVVLERRLPEVETITLAGPGDVIDIEKNWQKIGDVIKFVQKSVEAHGKIIVMGLKESEAKWLINHGYIVRHSKRGFEVVKGPKRTIHSKSYDAIRCEEKGLIKKKGAKN